MRQIAFVIHRMAPLAEMAGWEPDVGTWSAPTLTRGAESSGIDEFRGGARSRDRAATWLALDPRVTRGLLSIINYPDAPQCVPRVEQARSAA